jgi:hypothetical protein
MTQNDGLEGKLSISDKRLKDALQSVAELQVILSCTIY